jgi:hypothetical protein
VHLTLCPSISSVISSPDSDVFCHFPTRCNSLARHITILYQYRICTTAHDRIRAAVVGRVSCYASLCCSFSSASSICSGPAPPPTICRIRRSRIVTPYSLSTERTRGRWSFCKLAKALHAASVRRSSSAGTLRGIYSFD